MNKKGQTQEQLGLILLAFVTIIVGVVLFQVAAQQVGEVTNTVQVVNESLGDVTNGTAIYVITYRGINDVVILNETDASGVFTDNATVIGSGNYTITNSVVDPTTGGLAVRIDPTATVGWKTGWQISGTSQPLTYVPDSGSRAVTNLIVIFFALAVMVAALEPSIRMRILEMFDR